MADRKNPEKKEPTKTPADPNTEQAGQKDEVALQPEQEKTEKDSSTDGNGTSNRDVGKPGPEERQEKARQMACRDSAQKNRFSVRDDQEWAGYVYSDDETGELTSVSREAGPPHAKDNEIRVVVPAGHTMEYVWHSHGAAVSGFDWANFSDADWGAAKQEYPTGNTTRTVPFMLRRPDNRTKEIDMTRPAGQRERENVCP